VAPIIPGLNDDDMAHVLRAARAAGASHASRALLRLPGSVKDVFVSALRSSMPLRADRILHLIRETRRGKLYESAFHSRGAGEGAYAETVDALFTQTAERLGLATSHPADAEESTTFRRPGGQLALF
jgi:DNA repair photolyase